MAVTLIHPVREASAMGAEHGKAAASWAFDGRTADHIYRAFLVGYDEGDPMVMDHYDPASPLSGEWADGLTPDGLLADVGVDPDEAPEWQRDEVCDAYETSFSDAYWAELQRVAHLHTDDDGTDVTH